MSHPTYSIVVPVFNEESSLPQLLDRLSPVLDGLDADAEVIVVDDGSTDRSVAFVEEIRRLDPRFKLVQLSRNFGHQLAITAGLDLAVGDAVIVMDADLQDPPEVVLQMATHWRAGYEVVYGTRSDRGSDTRFKRGTAGLFYRVLNRLTDVDIPLDTGDFRLVDRRALDAFKSMREGGRFVRGMFAWVGFRTTRVEYARGERVAGDTKYPLRKMLRLAGDAVVGFSRSPLRIVLYLGLSSVVLGVLAALMAVAGGLSGALAVPGWFPAVLAITLFGGVQLAALGLVGEYAGRIHEETLRRPLYVVSRTEGLNHPLAAPRSYLPPTKTVNDSLREIDLDHIDLGEAERVGRNGHVRVGS